jgi:hypothetical protein
MSPHIFVPKPDCWGRYPFCPKIQKDLDSLSDPMKEIEIPSCICWRLCRMEYLSKVFNNPSYKHGRIFENEQS